MLERFERFSLNISESYRCWHKLAGDEMKVYGLKGAHAIYLTMIAHHPEGITVTELCERCFRDKSDASRMLGILEKEGLVRKEGKHKSTYGGVICLTEAGMEVAKHIEKRVERAVEAAGKDLTEAEREIFYKALDSITGNLQRLTDDGIPE